MPLRAQAPVEPAEPREPISAADSMTLMEIARGCLSCSTEDAFRALFSKLRELLPLHRAYAIVGRLDARRRLLISRCVNLGFPPEFVHEYAERRYFQIDPVLKDAFESDRVTHLYEPTVGRPRQIASLCREFDVTGSSVHGARPCPHREKQCVLFFNAPFTTRDRRAAAILELIAPHFQFALSRAGDEGLPRADPVALSAREREVAHWLMEGKCSWDVSVILGISERTVNFHVGNLLRKLGATSRAQAMALAARWGLVD